MWGRGYGKWLVGCFGALNLLGAGALAAEHDSSALAPGLGKLQTGSSAASRWGVPDRGRNARARAAAASAPMAGQVFGRCFYSVSPTTVSDVSAAGASGSITVSWHYEPSSEFPNEEDASVCEDNWSASSGVTWISVRESETDNDVANYTVSANSSTATRSGTITVAGESITVSQLAGTPPSCSVSATGGGQVGQAISLRGTLTPSDASAVFRWKATRMSGGQPVETHTPSEGTSSSFTPGNAGRWVFGLTVQKPRGTNVATCSSERTVSASCPSSPSVSSSSLSFTHDSGSTTVRVQEAGTCSYSVNDNRNWISVRPATVSGNGTVTVTVQSNSGSSSRSGVVTIGNRSLRITQEPDTVDCPVSPRVSSSSLSFGHGSGSTTVRVQEAATCSYSVNDNRNWINVRPATVSGNGTVTVIVQAHSGSSSRSGTVTIGNRNLDVLQEPRTVACPPSPSVSSSSLSFGHGSSSTTVTVQETATCSYSVSDSRSWISVRPSTVAGNGTVNIEVDRNPATNSRSGHVTIGSRSVSVRQAASTGTTCPQSPAVEPAAVSLSSAAGQSGSVGLQESAACRYRVVENVAWLRTGASNVAGNETITFETESANDTGAARLGTLTIGNTSVTVRQCASLPPRVFSPPRLSVPGRGGTVIVGVPDVTDCSWPVTDDQEWITTNRTSISGREKLWVTVAPNPDATRTGTVMIGDWQVNVVQEPLTRLSAKRDQLLEDYAARGVQDDACAAWNSLHSTAQEVFIWNTHRLHLSGMLEYVDRLHAVYGKGPGCGGGDFNRTYMSMRPELQLKWLDVYYERDNREFSLWRRTRDLACSPLARLSCLIVDGGQCNCPHWPFDLQIETYEGNPRGQINFFHPPDYIPVSRSYFVSPGQVACGTELMWTLSESVCTDGDHCSCGTDGLCPLETAPPSSCRPQHFQDQVLSLPSSYRRGPPGHVLTILEPGHRLMFEMDQDYNADNFHDSAPSCNNMKHQYSSKYQGPGWDWAPSSCHATPGTMFSDAGLVPRAMQMRAPHIEELRQRIDAQRVFYGLRPTVWTDARIVAGVTPVKAAHLTELRTALSATYAAAGLDSPAYTDDPIVSGTTPIRAVHIVELRTAVTALEQQP